VLSGDVADQVADSREEQSQVEFGSGFGAVTDIQIGPEGAVYVTSIGDGTVYRMPEPASSTAIAAGALALTLMGRFRAPPRARLS
jgi:hypothetical protein